MVEGKGRPVSVYLSEDIISKIDIIMDLKRKLGEKPSRSEVVEELIRAGYLKLYTDLSLRLQHSIDLQEQVERTTDEIITEIILRKIKVDGVNSIEL